MCYMITALKLKPFLDNLCENLAKNLNDLWTIVSKYMQLKELRDFHKKVCIEEMTERRGLEKKKFKSIWTQGHSKTWIKDPISTTTSP